MPYVECCLRSDLLQTRVNVSLYFPNDLPPEIGCETKGTLTLLHGYTNSGADWMQMSSAARYAADNGLALICPSCQNSFYQDTYRGAWKTFVAEEMPELLSRTFRFPRARERNFIAGLSMGGYGALYLALSRPELYAGCASFSGVVDVQMLLDSMPTEMRRPLASAFDCEDTGKIPPESSLYTLAPRVAALPAAQQPKILMTNGLEDTEIYKVKQQNDALCAVLRTLPLADFQRMEWHGVHEWKFWDRSLVYAIDHFLGNGYAAQKHEDWRAEPIVT
ncbi:MAG: alpha/beta hydrolase-fold protein [Ruthenibacterium sp.]